MKVSLTRPFLRRFTKYEPDFQSFVLERIAEFEDVANHKRLKVHKLHGQFVKFYSFSVNYKTRIVFEYVSKTEVALLAIGDHDIYN